MKNWNNETEKLFKNIPTPNEINIQQKTNTFVKQIFPIEELSEKLNLHVSELDYYSAVKYCSDVVSKAPSWVPAWNFLGNAYKAAGLYQLLRQNMPVEGRINILKRCIELYPSPNYYAKLNCLKRFPWR